MSEDEILTIREVAALLKIGSKTAYTMAQEGGLGGADRLVRRDKRRGRILLKGGFCRALNQRSH